MYLLTDELVAWAKGESAETALGDNIEFLCAVDGMIHAAKGAFGLRIDGVDDVSIDSMIIENIVEYSALGYELCGKCNKCAFEARTPYQMGYAGNMAQGISADYAANLKVKDLTISGVEAKTGRAIGFSVWPGTSVTFDGDIVVEDIIAGDNIARGSLSYSSRPNAAPEACAIRVYNEDAYQQLHDDNDIATVTLTDDVSITTKCVAGHSTCWDLANTYSQVGDNTGDCDDSQSQSSNKKLIDVASRIRTTHKINNHKFTFAISAMVLTLLGIIFYMFKLCTRDNKMPLLKTESEKVPLMDYGSFQFN
jgi:hypothetical protein